MECDRYLELLALRGDGELSGEEEQELEAHLAACPACRAAGAQLAALQGAFPELEGVGPPEGFAQGVMDHIRAAKTPKVIPLFKRPQFRALVGLAACLVLVVGLYGASLRQKPEEPDLMARSFSRDAAEDIADVSACDSLTADEDAPQIAAYAAPEMYSGVQKAAPNPATDSLNDDWTLAEVTLTLDRLPEGAAELIPPDATVSHDVETGMDVYAWLTAEELAAIEELAFEQGLIPGTTECSPTPERCALIVRNK